jgi:hypothetical protein
MTMDPVWAETALSLGVGLGLAAAAGLRVFVPLLVLGSAARLGWLPLASGFEWLSSGFGLATLSVATVLEVSAYYIPWVDNLLDVVAGPLAVMAGIVATAAVTTELPPALRWSAAIIAGGGTAAAVQGLTSLARLKSTALTAGTANPLLATIELVGSIATSLVAIVLPALAIFTIVGLLWLARRLGRRWLRRVPATP